VITKFPRTRLAVVSLLIALWSVLTAYHRSFTGQNLASYDDEGTLMIIVKRFLDGHALYDDVGVFYGPFYYLYEWCAHAGTGTPVSHDSVRFVSMFFWVSCAMLLFLLVYRATSSLLLAAAAHFLAFKTLSFIGIGPAHPQELCITLLVALALVACSVSTRNSLMISLGALAGGMMATKINLGVFAVLALAVAFAFAAKRGRARNPALIVVSAAVLVFPVALMWGHHKDWWAIKYCFVSVISLAAAILTVSCEHLDFSFGLPDLLAASFGFLTSIAALGAFAIAHGSSVHAMIDFLIVRPRASFGQSWYREALVPDLAIPWALVGLACAVCATSKRFADELLPYLKLVFGMAVGLLCLANLYDASMSFVPPFLWMVAVRPRNTLPLRIGALSRAILAMVAVIQVLYAYPVAGQQVLFTVVMMIPAAAICLSDSLAFVCARLPQPRVLTLSRAGTASTIMALGVLYLGTVWGAVNYYGMMEPLGLHGAERLRIEPEKADVVRDLAREIVSSPCTMLAGAPELFSFNFFTGKPAPQSIDFGAWMLGMSDEDQRKAVQELSQERFPCVIYNQRLIDFWTHKADVSSKPLIQFINYNFQVVFQNSDYQLMEPKGMADFVRQRRSARP
jgi:hypothetical protein